VEWSFNSVLNFTSKTFGLLFASTAAAGYFQWSA